MIKIIYGTKGSGKTKKIIDMANDSISTCDGHIVFLSDTNRYMYEIKRAVRFIQTSEYKIGGQEQLLAFIKGIAAANTDNKLIFIDGLARILKIDVPSMQSFYEGLDTLTSELDITFVVTVSAAEIPDFLKDYEVVWCHAAE